MCVTRVHAQLYVCVYVRTPGCAVGAPMHVSCEPFSNLQYNPRSGHAGCCSLFTRELLSDCQQIVRPTQPATIDTHTHTPSPQISLSLALFLSAADVIEWALRYYDSEMDRQVETDRLRNTAGNIGSSLIMRPVNLNASRLSSRASRLTTEAAISSLRKYFRVISYPWPRPISKQHCCQRNILIMEMQSLRP